MPQKILAAFILIFAIVYHSSTANSDQRVKIAIYQHFGAEYQVKKLNIKTSNSKDKLLISINNKKDEDSVFSTQSLRIQTKDNDSQYHDWVEFISQIFEEKTVVAGNYGTYEDAYYWQKILEKNYPLEKWTIVYARPWRVETQSRTPKLLVEELKKNNFQPSIENNNQINKDLSLQWNGMILNTNNVDIHSQNNKPIIINGRKYPGYIRLFKDSQETYSVINVLDMQDYLRGVVPYEIGADSPKAALEAQVVLARTYLLANRDRYSIEDYDLCSTQHCQVYKGLNQVDNRINQAIFRTRDLVLTDPNDQIAEVFYYSCDGGHSANYADAWASPPKDEKFKYLEGQYTCNKNGGHKFNFSKETDIEKFLLKVNTKKLACYDQVSGNHRFRWKRSFSQEKVISNLLKAKKDFKLKIPDFGSITDLQVIERSNSGRVIRLKVISNNNEFILERTHIRAAFGGLPSTFFIIKPNSKGFTFHGAGFGHGVGLSQYGARKLASEGKSCETILNIYFPKYKLKKLNNN